MDFALRDLVAHMARGIVDHPESVSVAVIEPGEDAVFELSLRLALSAAAGRHRRQADLEIAD